MEIITKARGKITVTEDRLITIPAGLFGFDYPAMIWYAAQGREWLYKTNYDGIYRMEHNLAVKIKRQTPMTSYERWRFRTTFLSKLRLD